MYGEFTFLNCLDCRDVESLKGVFEVFGESLNSKKL